MPLMRLPVLCCAMALLSLLSGCAAIGLSVGSEAAYNAAFRTPIEDPGALTESERAALADMPLHEAASPAGADSRGEVTGLACKLTAAVFVFRWTWRPELNERNGLTPEDAARTQLKLKALKRGAQAVYDTRCVRSEGMDLSNNCFESVVCTGTAAVLR